MSSSLFLFLYIFLWCPIPPLSTKPQLFLLLQTLLSLRYLSPLLLPHLLCLLQTPQSLFLLLLHRLSIFLLLCLLLFLLIINHLLLSSLSFPLHLPVPFSQISLPPTLLLLSPLFISHQSLHLLLHLLFLLYILLFIPPASPLYQLFGPLHPPTPSPLHLLQTTSHLLPGSPPLFTSPPPSSCACSLH